MNSNIPENIAEKICYVTKFVGTSTNDWFRVKKEILGVLAPKERSNFSRRHKSSKKYFLNDFEQAVIDFWKEKTGIVLEVDQTKLHKFSDERPPRYWGLMKYNETRKKASLKNE